MNRSSTLIVLGIAAVAALLTVSCEPERVTIGAGARDIAGTYIGRSWAGEARGTAFEDANQFIETVLELDSDANIVDARMLYWQLNDGFWITRQSGNAFIRTDFSVTPAIATIAGSYSPGRSMFTVYTASRMSLYIAAVNDAGITAFAIVDPITRFQFEARLPADFDFDRPFGDLNIANGLMIPTVRTAGGAVFMPDSWDEVADATLFDLHEYSHVLVDRGVWEGLDNSSSVRTVLERIGVEFSGGRPQPTAPVYGYWGIGGWAGNYRAVEQYIIGRNAREFTSLVDWSATRFEGSINDQNQFGVDVATGATNTAQNSYDGISGATVRMSRESTSFQRALVRAGIISEDDVIIGRF